MKDARIEGKFGYQFGSAPETHSLAADIVSWFEKQESVGSNARLLAHAEDGVIWGVMDKTTLKLSSEIASSPSPSLRPQTLIEARLFGERAQVHVWRTDGGFCASRIEDIMGAGESFDEFHRLWGTEGVEWSEYFTIVADGREGLMHAVPLVLDKQFFVEDGAVGYRPITLQARHFIAYDGDGQAFIAASRLVELMALKKEVRQ